ncbi:MAG: malate permease [Planctomycetaceae bacterium]|nr:MAG: malate permease [Planctomycetaceae bacterium]
MTDLLPIVSRVMGVFLVMGAGALARRLNWFTQEADGSLARLTAYVLLPALFVDRILGGPPFESLAVAWIPPLFGLISTAFGLVLALGMARRWGPRIGLHSDASQRAFALSVGVCNYGYIPLPLAQFFYPEAEVSLILHNVGVDLALWSVGIWVIGGTEGAERSRTWVSPPVIAILIALAMKQLGVGPWIPAPFYQMAAALGQCAIPLGLVLSGAILLEFFGQVRWRNAIGTVVAACGFRLLAMPVLMLATASLLAFSLEVRQVIVLQAAMPSAVFPVVLTRMFNKDVTTAVRSVLATGFAGIVTIPLWLYLGRLWLLG